MRCPLLLLVLVTLVGGLARAEPRREVPLRRQGEGTLAPRAAAADIARALVEAPWIFHNPAKKTSTWESRLYTFAADGAVTVTTTHVGRPTTQTRRWKVVGTGAARRVQIDSTRYRLERCAETLCLR